MKKIYLIDDNQDDGQKKYNASFIQEGLYDDILVHIKKIDIKDINNLSFLFSAQCILIHRSFNDYVNERYVDGSLKICTKIIEEISDNGENIPLVVFSDGDSTIASYNNEKYIPQIKKQFFYERLRDFLDYYRQYNRIELLILAYGKNYKKIIAQQYAKQILDIVSSRNNSEIILSNEANNIDAFRQLIKISGLDCTDIINDIEDNPITVCEFKNRINKLINSFNKYGKNIYPWK